MNFKQLWTWGPSRPLPSLPHYLPPPQSSPLKLGCNFNCAVRNDLMIVQYFAFLCSWQTISITLGHFCFVMLWYCRKMVPRCRSSTVVQRNTNFSTVLVLNLCLYFLWNYAVQCVLIDTVIFVSMVWRWLTDNVHVWLHHYSNKQVFVMLMQFSAFVYRMSGCCLIYCTLFDYICIHIYSWYSSYSGFGSNCRWHC